ncbi:hypothetical protein AGLY_003319 [Aphis glycines]|uniref:Transmembrane protein n=1 Tax=Aphis glycines TaxID=307491 RepID=A0A6G0U019_APHGL|nr:hypothetical protein AGLY_003319 [Aphis glycines]
MENLVLNFLTLDINTNNFIIFQLQNYLQIFTFSTDFEPCIKFKFFWSSEIFLPTLQKKIRIKIENFSGLLYIRYTYHIGKQTTSQYTTIDSKSTVSTLLQRWFKTINSCCYCSTDYRRTDRLTITRPGFYEKIIVEYELICATKMYYMLFYIHIKWLVIVFLWNIWNVGWIQLFTLLSNLFDKIKLNLNHQQKSSDLFSTNRIVVLCVSRNRVFSFVFMNI